MDLAEQLIAAALMVAVTATVAFTIFRRTFEDLIWSMSDVQREIRRDRVTGLPNRRVADKKLSDIADSDGTVSVLLADINGFSAINDAHGHIVGDLVLAHVARTIRHALPRAFVARLRSDEFLIIMAKEHATAMSAARTVHDRFRDTTVHPGRKGHPVPVSVSIGVATGNLPPHQRRRLLHAADQALAQAKTLPCRVHGTAETDDQPIAARPQTRIRDRHRKADCPTETSTTSGCATTPQGQVERRP